MIFRDRKFFAGLLFTIAAPAFGAGLVSSMPVARIFPEPGGILYPGFNTAAGVNAAAIPITGRGTAIQVAGTPALQSGDPTDLFGSVATTRGNFGFGAGYVGQSQNSHLTNGGFVGMGYNFDPMSVGLSVRDFDVNGNYASVDAGFEFETKSEITIGAVLYNLNHDTQADIGVGTKSGKKYNLEANVLLPAFNNWNMGYVGTLSASIVPGMIGFHFSTSYYTAPKTWEYVIGVGAFLTENIQLVAQYATTRRATGALTIIF